MKQRVWNLENEALGLTAKTQTQSVIVGFNTWYTKQNRGVKSKTMGLMA